MGTRISFGDKIADKVATFAGSWGYVTFQSVVIAFWIIYNLVPGVPHFDEFPFVFLNLYLGFLAAYTGPFILMSQGRQEDRDRKLAEADDAIDRRVEAANKEILERVRGIEASVNMLLAVHYRDHHKGAGHVEIPRRPTAQGQ